MKNHITISVGNMQAHSGRREENLQKIHAFIAEAAGQSADLLLLPELCVQGYDFFSARDIAMQEKRACAEPLQGESCAAILKAARAQGMYVVFGMAELGEDGNLYNTAVAACPDGALLAYRKIHLFGDEHIAFTAGSEPLLLQTPWGPVGIGICYDTFQFPELLRYYVYKGARLYLNPTAMAEEVEKPGSRQAFLNYYKPTLEYGVLANTIFLASANLTGRDCTRHFGGGSMVIGPKDTEFFETDVTCYAGNADDLHEGISTTTLDLALAIRRLCAVNPVSGRPDYRPEVYRRLWEE